MNGDMENYKVIGSEKVDYQVTTKQFINVSCDNKFLLRHKITKNFHLGRVDIIAGEKEGKFFIGALFIEK